MPMPVSLIVKEFGFEGRMFFNLAEEMIRDHTIKGSITGGRSVGKATYIPANYAKAQNEWIENFFAQNGYLEYDAISRLGKLFFMFFKSILFALCVPCDYCNDILILGFHHCFITFPFSSTIIFSSSFGMSGL